MRAAFERWSAIRTLREQRLLLVMFGLLGVVIVWLGVIRPVGDGLSDARERHGHAVTELAQITARAEALRAIDSGETLVLAAPLATVIEQSAGAAGFTPSSIAPQDSGRVAVAIGSVRPIAFFAWIGGLERQGIIVERLSARANSDPTLSVDVTLRARGR